jgi:catechol 2,3-dioxygenase-like lactoylglutathione lyase family enzyme
MWTHITAQLNVPDLEEALEWYRVHLGCRVAWRNDERSFGAVYNGTTEIFFNQTSEPGQSTAGSVLCIRVPDVDSVYAAARDAEAPIIAELADRPWQMREFEVRDPWGHRLRIAQSLLL